MSWLYSPVGGEGCLVANYSAGSPSAMLSGMPMPSKSSRRASGTDALTMLQSGTTVLVSTGHPGVDWWMSSLRVSRASLSVKQERDLPKTIPATDGLPSNASLAKYDLKLHGWKMCQASFPSLISDEYLGTWPRSGTMRNGVVYRRLPLELPTSGKDYGLLPTPRASRSTWDNNHGKKTLGLPGLARAGLLPTPTTGSHRSGTGAKPRTGHGCQLQDVFGGLLNPPYVEEMMMWPIGWTDLQPLEMDRFQKWLEQHGNFSQPE